MNDIWGDMELDMLRESVKSLDAERTTLIEKNQHMKSVLHLLKSKVDSVNYGRGHGPHKDGHKGTIWVELEELIKAGLK